MSHRLSEASDDDVLVYSTQDIGSYHPEIASSPSLQSLVDRAPTSRRSRARTSTSTYRTSPKRPNATLDPEGDGAEDEEDDDDEPGLEMNTLNKGSGVRFYTVLALCPCN
jgi:hypothetical protein